MRMLGATQTVIHLLGELVMVAAGAWGLWLRFGQLSSPVPTTSWFGPLAILASGLLLVVLPIGPVRDAAWMRDWARPQLGLSSLLWSFGLVGCLYSLWLQYSLEFNLRPVLMLLPAFAYWFIVTSPGLRQQQSNIERVATAQTEKTHPAAKVEEVQRA